MHTLSTGLRFCNDHVSSDFLKYSNSIYKWFQVNNGCYKCTNPIKFISIFHYLKNRKPSVTHLVQTVKTIAVSRPFSISLYWFGTQTQTPNSCESIFFSNQFTVTIKAFYQSLIFMFIKGALFFAIS